MHFVVCVHTLSTGVSKTFHNPLDFMWSYLAAAMFSSRCVCLIPFKSAFHTASFCLVRLKSLCSSRNKTRTGRYKWDNNSISSTSFTLSPCWKNLIFFMFDSLCTILGIIHPLLSVIQRRYLFSRKKKKVHQRIASMIRAKVFWQFGALCHVRVMWRHGALLVPKSLTVPTVPALPAMQAVHSCAH